MESLPSIAERYSLQESTCTHIFETKGFAACKVYTEKRIMGDGMVAFLLMEPLVMLATAGFPMTGIIKGNSRKMQFFNNLFNSSPPSAPAHSLERIIRAPFRRRQVLDRNIGSVYHDLCRRLKAFNAEATFPIFVQVHIDGIIKCDDDDMLKLLNTEKVNFCITNSIHIPLLAIDVVKSNEASSLLSSKRHALENAGIRYFQINEAAAVRQLDELFRKRIWPALENHI